MAHKKNRKLSGVILTGAFAAPAVMSSAQQNVASADLGDLLSMSNMKAMAQGIWANPVGKVGVILFVAAVTGCIFWRALTGSNKKKNVKEKEKEKEKVINVNNLDENDNNTEKNKDDNNEKEKEITKIKIDTENNKEDKDKKENKKIVGKQTTINSNDDTKNSNKSKKETQVTEMNSAEKTEVVKKEDHKKKEINKIININEVDGIDNNIINENNNKIKNIDKDKDNNNNKINNKKNEDDKNKDKDKDKKEKKKEDKKEGKIIVEKKTAINSNNDTKELNMLKQENQITELNSSQKTNVVKKKEINNKNNNNINNKINNNINNKINNNINNDIKIDQSKKNTTTISTKNLNSDKKTKIKENEEEDKKEDEKGKKKLNSKQSSNIDKSFKEIIIDTVNNIKDSDIKKIMKKYQLDENQIYPYIVKEAEDKIKNEKTIEKMAKNQIDITEKAAQEIVNNKIDEIVKKITEREKLKNVVLSKIEKNRAARNYEEIPRPNISNIIMNRIPGHKGDCTLGVNVYFDDKDINFRKKIGGFFRFHQHNFTLNFLDETEEYIFTSNIGNIAARSKNISEIIEKINEAFDEIYPDQYISIDQEDIDFILGKTKKNTK